MQDWTDGLIIGLDKDWAYVCVGSNPTPGTNIAVSGSNIPVEYSCLVSKSSVFIYVLLVWWIEGKCMENKEFCRLTGHLTTILRYGEIGSERLYIPHSLLLPNWMVHPHLLHNSSLSSERCYSFWISRRNEFLAIIVLKQPFQLRRCVCQAVERLALVFH